MFNPSTYNTVSLQNNVTIAYISAGAPGLPTILLLHGFPSSSNQYRNLIPLLSHKYHVIAPDLPSYGSTTTPLDYQFSFSNLTNTIVEFLEILTITCYAVYTFDYGAPTAFRLALQNPASIKAIISQNGNAYVEGLGHPFWDPIEALWASDNAAADRENIRKNVFTLATTKFQYTAGFPENDLPLIDPVAYTYDYLQNLQTPEKQEAQLDLLYDYRTNIELYPDFQAYLRKSQVPLLAIWGKGDPVFIPAGAEAFKRDLKEAVVKFVDAGHFALETKVGEIAKEILEWLNGIGY